MAQRRHGSGYDRSATPNRGGKVSREARSDAPPAAVSTGRVRMVLTLLLVVAVATVALLIGRFFDPTTTAQFVERLQSYGGRWWAPIAFIAAFMVISLTGLPGTPLTLAAGAVWGWAAGTWWVMLATMIGTALPYQLARQGVPGIKWRLEKRFGSVLHRIQKEGLTAILVLRMLHVFPFAVISYAAGFASARPRDYFVGTFFGTLPSVIVYTYFADAILEGVVSPEKAAGRMVIAGLILAAFIVITRVATHRFGR